jgi:hypothetical protein
MRYKRINNMNKSKFGDLEWLDNYENVWSVGMHLAEYKYGWEWAKTNLAHYFEKPYRYTDEYLEWRKYMDWEKNESTTESDGYWSWLEIQQQNAKELSDN